MAKGFEVAIHGGHPPAAPQRALEVDVGSASPSAFTGLRKLLRGLEAADAATVKAAASANASVWNRLFPGTFPEAPDLAQRVLSPSERRLHRESEQVFWVLNFGAQVLLDVVRATGRPVVLRNTGRCDLVSLRGVMRAVEWSRVLGGDWQLTLGEWSLGHPGASATFEPTRAAYRASLAKRMRANLEPGSCQVEPFRADAPLDPEERFLNACTDPALPPEQRIAAAVAAIKAAFFTSNYEGAMLAAEQGLALLGGASAAAVGDHFKALDAAFDTPAVEIEPASLGTASDVGAVLWRSIGVVRSFTGDHEAALAAFNRGLELATTPPAKARLCMYKALTLIKKLGQADAAREVLDHGLALLAPESGAEVQLERGWLRNVRGLTYFQERRLEPALEEEKKAIAAVGSLHDLRATHLKINLISNVSVLQEAAGRYEEALRTWHRFDDISGSWGEAFLKHHRYRSAGLHLSNGAKEEAEKRYKDAYQNALALGDWFHREVIASELGRFCLQEQRREDAAAWYAQAVEAAEKIGDPFKMAETLAGQALATGSLAFDRARAVAGETTTYPKQARRLIDALDAGGSAVLELLPVPRTKLNRPFDLVNLYS